MIDYHIYTAKNGYRLTPRQLKYWAKRHEKAVKDHDKETVEWIEDMLTDINYHSECGLFHEGNYEKR